MSKAFGPLLRHGARRGLPTQAGFARDGSTSSTGLSRRDVLRFGARGVAASLLAPALGQLAGCSNGANGKGQGAGLVPTVIVVGAGFSGLACADTLAAAGLNVVVLEATGRPGGRVRTDRAFIAGDNVELGGEWIGRNHPTWLAYAQEFNLRLEEPNAAPEPAPTTDRAEDEAPPTLPPRPGEPTPHVGDPDPAPTEPAPGAAGNDSPSGPAFTAPRPKPFETEMDAPAGKRASADHASRADVRLAVLAQPDGRDAQPGPAPADAAAAPPPDGAAATTQPSTTTTTHSGEPQEPIILNGKLIRGEAADQLYKEVDQVLARLIELAREVDPVRPWLSPRAAEHDARSFAAFVDDQKGLSDTARALLLSTAETDNGVVPERMSLLAYLSMVAGGGFQSYFDDSEVYRLADGNDALATALAQKLGDRLHFNTTVDLVRREADGVIVRTRGGEVYRGKAVVIAVPPSVWGRITLLPALEQTVQPQMGANVKLIVALREAVWEKQGLTSELQSDGAVGMSWAATDPLSRGPVALTLFSGGHQAEELRRLEPITRDERAFQSVAPAYPDLRAAYLRERFVDWPGMPLTQASYSFPAPGQVTAYGPLLVDGIAGDGRAPLMFAGEHTAYGFIGYMEGALSSGVRVAKTLLGEATPVTAPPSPATTGPSDAVPPADAPAQPDAPQPAPGATETQGVPA